MESRKPLQLLALNHVSRVCADLPASYRFYTEVLGFTAVKRPSSFNFEGAWLHNYGIGLHLIKGCPPPRPKAINPKSCHISFQAASIKEVEDSLLRQSIPFVKNIFLEDGIQVQQLFFHDPDNNMIEICNCDVLPVVPLKPPPPPPPSQHDEHIKSATATVTTVAALSEAVAAVKAVCPASSAEPPLSPTSATSSTGTCSDTGSDVDVDTTCLLHNDTFDAAALLGCDEVAVACERGGGGGNTVGRQHECDRSSSSSSSSFSSCSSSTISDVIMTATATDSFAMRITGPSLAPNWSKLGSSSSSDGTAAPGSFVLELKQQFALL